ncbi:MAG: mannose-6-phosphate isomerase [Clostridiales bacterium]|nr:MAG: mannose-6-phosphate isomerase [Clostridiales bacterium]
MHKIPLLLSYLPKTALWGGGQLQALFQKESPFEKLSETWELSVREGNDSRILNGPDQGKTLREYLGPAHRPFPLLIKFIDAADRLSVQVHPDDAYAAREHDQGKTELWHILRAKPGAEIIYGLREGAGPAAFKEALQAGRLDTVLHHQPVSAGETYFIPAGMVHGIGAGIVVAEIQQNSDLTYRVYDYGRRDQNGRLRPLQIDQALSVIRPFTPEQIRAIQFARGETGLANCPYFSVELLHAPVAGRADRFTVLLATGGSGAIIKGGCRLPLQAGNCCFLPDQMGDYEINGDLTFLKVKENLT